MIFFEVYLFHMFRDRLISGKNKLSFGITLVLLWQFAFVCGANDSLSLINNLRLGVDLQYGSVLPHHASIEYALESNITGFEVHLTTDTYGRSNWDELYRYPRMGTGFLVTSLGNRKVYGTAEVLFLFVDIPMNTQPRKLFAGYQISFGLSYIDKLYDVVENPLNMAISTRLNVYANLRFNAKYVIKPGNEIAASFGFSHFSNGKISSPNQGINTGIFTLGYNYVISQPRYSKISNKKFTVSKRHIGEVVLSGGVKSDDQVNRKSYLISTLTSDYYYFFSRKYAAGIGIDFFYDQTLGPNMVAQNGGEYNTSDLFQCGVHGAIYAKYGRLYIVGNIGPYLHATFIKYARFYTRIGIRYEATPHILLNISLKAHYAIADYVEWGIGYRI